MISSWSPRKLMRQWMCIPIFLCSLAISGTALMITRPFLVKTQLELINSQKTIRLSTQVRGRKDDRSNEEEAKSTGFFKRFKRKKEEEEGEILTEDDSSAGVFGSISKKISSIRESREERNRLKREAELAALLDLETQSGMVSFPFNTTTVASAFRNVSVGLNQVKDEIRSIRTGKNGLSEDEKKLVALRMKSRENKQRRIIAQQFKEQKELNRRIKEEAEGDEKTKTSTRQEIVKDDSAMMDDSSNKRSNPLSVAQKYFAGFFDGSKENDNWLVVAPKTRISPGEMVPVTAAGLDLLLVASKDGSALYCIANSCPHLGTPLEVGTLERRPAESSMMDSLDGFSTDDAPPLQEIDIAKLLAQDGCEDCIVCPLHKTAFALESGEVRGEWCPYPPVIGKVMGTIKGQSNLPTFDVRTKGKNIEVRLSSLPKVLESAEDS